MLLQATVVERCEEILCVAEARLDQSQAAVKSRRPTTTCSSEAQDENTMNRNMAQDILNMQMDKYCVLSKLMLQCSASQPVPSGSLVGCEFWS